MLEISSSCLKLLVAAARSDLTTALTIAVWRLASLTRVTSFTMGSLSSKAAAYAFTCSRSSTVGELGGDPGAGSLDVGCLSSFGVGLDWGQGLGSLGNET